MLGFAVRTVVILGVSAGAAGGYAALRGLSWVPDLERVAKQEQRRDAVRAQSEQIRAELGIELEEFLERIAQGAVVIDARPRDQYETEHLLIESWPPVLNIEPETVVENSERLNALLMSGQALVLYCTSAECELAEELLVELEAIGFERGLIRIYVPGWEGIKAAGLPTTSGPDTWTPDAIPGVDAGLGADGAEEAMDEGLGGGADDGGR